MVWKYLSSALVASVRGMSKKCSCEVTYMHMVCLEAMGATWGGLLLPLTPCIPLVKHVLCLLYPLGSLMIG